MNATLCTSTDPGSEVVAFIHLSAMFIYVYMLVCKISHQKHVQLSKPSHAGQGETRVHCHIYTFLNYLPHIMEELSIVKIFQMVLTL